jgi:hypothetical protein
MIHGDYITSDLMKELKFIFLLSFLFSCSPGDWKRDVYMSDDDYVEFDRQFSPDGSMMILNYGIDIGAYGMSLDRSAILMMTDTTQNLTDFELPLRRYARINWIDNRTIDAKIDIIPSLKSGQQIVLKDIVVNGVNVKESPYDYMEPGSKMVIEHREISPNGKYELVAYRYFVDTRNINFIHVSVIEAGKQIPKYGNYLIGDSHSDYVLNGNWDKDNTLIFFTQKFYEEMIPYALVRNRPNIRYRVISDDETYGSKYRWYQPLRF